MGTINNVSYVTYPRMNDNSNGFNLTLSEIKITPGCRHHSIKIYTNGKIEYKYDDSISVERNPITGQYYNFTGDNPVNSDIESTYIGSFNGQGKSNVMISTTMKVKSVKSTIEIK